MINNNSKNKYKLRLELATIKELKQTYMSIQDLTPDPEVTKALEWFDLKEKEVYDKI